MSSRYWIKLYHEILDDPKMGRLPDALFRRTIELFLMAGDYGREGRLPPLADIGWRLRVPEDILSAQMDALREVEILSRDENDGWVVTHFKERQAAEPTSLRSRRYRDSLQKQHNRHECVTNRDADVDRDKDTDAEEKGDADAPCAGSGCDPADELVKTFIDHTHIPLNTGGEEKWAKALARLNNAGVEKVDIISALGECYQKGIVIANLGSIVNPAIICMARRKGRANKEEDYTRYLKGEYGEWLRGEQGLDCDLADSNPLTLHRLD